MEEFDRHIKAKIESLTEIPGVEFNEKHVWRKIRSNWSRNFTFLTVVIVLLINAVVVFHLLNENKSEHVPSSISRESKSGLLVDPNSDVISEEAVPAENDTIKETDPVTKHKGSVVNTSKGEVHIPASSVIEVLDHLDQPMSSDETYRSPSKEKTPIVKRGEDQINDIQREVSISSGKESQTVGVTHLKRLDNRFSLSYGIHFNRSWNNRFNISEGQNKHFEFYQIQIPVGLRYNLRQEKGPLIPFLYSGFKNSFLFRSNSTNMDYNLRFESEVGIDVRIFSTEDGKRGYLRFKYPIYNKNIINQGIHRPSLYDALKE